MRRRARRARRNSTGTQLRARVAACTRCSLSATRTQTVFGVGNPQAEWLIVGEAPGAEEDRQGEPFVGRAGQLLNSMLRAIGLAREQVYIANVLKCRPPGNRDPSAERGRRVPALSRAADRAAEAEDHAGGGAHRGAKPAAAPTRRSRGCAGRCTLSVPPACRWS